MSNLYFAVHEIHYKRNGKDMSAHQEVFEPKADDLDSLIALGAVRDATKEEVAFYNLINSTKDPVQLQVELKKVAEKARAAATKAEEVAVEAEKASAAKQDDAALKKAAEKARAAAAKAEDTAAAAEKDAAGGAEDFGV